MIPVPGCFPKGTLVHTPNGDKYIDQLIPFEKILTLDSEGRRKWTFFYCYADFEPQQDNDFILFHLSNGVELVVTGDHLLFAYGQRYERVPRKAKDFRPGDRMIYLATDQRNLEKQDAVITKMSKVTSKGFYTPLTMAGHFLANGILSSCYTEIGTFKAPHRAFAPLRSWYLMKRKFGMNVKNDTEGIHGYCDWLMKIRDKLPSKITSRFD